MPFYPQGRLERAQGSLDSIVSDERADHGTGRMIDARDNVGPHSYVLSHMANLDAIYATRLQLLLQG
jgi:hypothetical protein